MEIKPLLTFFNVQTVRLYIQRLDTWVELLAPNKHYQPVHCPHRLESISDEHFETRSMSKLIRRM